MLQVWDLVSRVLSFWGKCLEFLAVQRYYSPDTPEFVSDRRILDKAKVESHSQDSCTHFVPF